MRRRNLGPLRGKPSPELLLRIKITLLKLPQSGSLLTNRVPAQFKRLTKTNTSEFAITLETKIKAEALHSPYPQLQIKHQIIILMPFGNCFPGSLHFARKTTRVPSQIFTIRRRSVAVKHGSFHIIDNIARDVSRFTLRLPDANPGETLVIIHAPSSVNGETFHAEILAPEQTVVNLHNAVTLRDPVLPLPLVTVPVRPHQSALAVNHAVLPFPDILVPVLPNVTAVTVLHVALPPPFV